VVLVVQWQVLVDQHKVWVKSDVQQLLGIGGLQQQQAQQEYATDFQNLLAQEKAPFEVLGAGANILQQLSPQNSGSTNNLTDGYN
jgi:hypothetical protein